MTSRRELRSEDPAAEGPGEGEGASGEEGLVRITGR
jgi:hypothetical protein